MKRIAVFGPRMGMGTCLYRLAAPFADLRRSKNLHVDRLDKLEWDEAGLYDYAFFLWPNTPGVLDAIGKFRFMGVPIWVDFDDDPWNLPPDNPASEQYKPGSELMNCVEYAAKEADVVSVSTTQLSYVFGNLNKNCQVIPNAYWGGMWPMSKLPRKKCILWRGALGHNKDLESVFPAIVELQERYSDWPWIFIGEPDPEIIKLLKKEQTITIPYQHPNAYMRTLIDLAAPIQIVPLLDHDFNKTKSNCSWLEASCAGTAVLAPSYLPEFDKPGITRYDNPDDFQVKLEDMMKNWEKLPELVERSRWEIGKKYLLTDVNEKRAKILGL